MLEDGRGSAVRVCVTFVVCKRAVCLNVDVWVCAVGLCSGVGKQYPAMPDRLSAEAALCAPLLPDEAPTLEASPALFPPFGSPVYFPCQDI